MRPMNVPSIITPYVLSSAGIFGRANPGGIEEPELIVASISYKKGKLEVGYAKDPGMTRRAGDACGASALERKTRLVDGRAFIRHPCTCAYGRLLRPS